MSVAMPNFADPPFAVPAEIVHVLDLPCPPSINALWRSNRGRVHKSAAYTNWLTGADAAAVLAGVVRGRKIIAGSFEARIRVVRSATRADIDNVGTKALFDWAQSRGFIADDKNCVRYSVEWTAADMMPNTCRLTLRSLHGASE
jgi:Holliday junction resolvase RusA-like endonuclease